MNILCGTDFSAASASAVKAAVNLARRFQDTLVLAHSFDASALSTGDLGSLDLSFRKAAAESLKALASTLGAEGLAVEECLLDGHADVTLVEQARKMAARLIVLGTHGRRAPARWLLGSTAERVLDSADRPVLVVPRGGSELGRWARGPQPLEVTVGLDASRAGDAAVEGLRMLRRAGPCDVTFVHLYYPPAAHQRFGLDPPTNTLVPDLEVSALFERELRPRIADLPGEGRTTLQIRPCWGPFGVALGELSAGADLFVLGTHQRSRWSRGFGGSVAHTALREACAPLLCLPAAALPEPEVRPSPRLAHVLIAVDFSPIAGEAVRYGCALARGGGLVQLCHVFEPPLATRVGVGTQRSRMTAEQRTELLERLEQLAMLAPPEAQVTTRTLVVEGEPAEAIVQTAERLDVDAICIASHDRTGITRAVHGSVGVRVMHKSSKPVLVVHPRAQG